MTAMGYTQVLGDDIQATAQYAETVATDIEQELKTLYSWLYEIQAIWKGIASDTFNLLMTDFSVYADMINNALGGIAAGLRGNWANYANTEEQNIANLKLVNGALPGSPGATPPA